MKQMMKINFLKIINDYSSLVWAAVSSILVILYLFDIIASNIGINISVLLVVNLIINLARCSKKFRARKLIFAVDWFVYQSALLILTSFAHLLSSDEPKIYWLGLIAISTMFFVTRFSLKYLMKRFMITQETQDELHIKSE
jgi:hypothetical protein